LSWINQVERWFGYLTGQKIRRGVYKSVQALEADIRDWIGTWNENLRPFAWTKTAEEILNSLAELFVENCRRGTLGGLRRSAGLCRRALELPGGPRDLTPGHPAKLQASVLNPCLRQLASLQYVVWRTPYIPGSVMLNYLHDWDRNNCRGGGFRGRNGQWKLL
jgi:hypothetical protein